MSVKDVKDYYNKVSADYHELILTLQDMEEEYKNKLVSPDTLKSLERQIEPIKTNFRTISYIIYLLNKPTKKSKQNRYKKQNKKLLEMSRTLEEVQKENKNVLNNIRAGN